MNKFEEILNRFIRSEFFLKRIESSLKAKGSNIELDIRQMLEEYLGGDYKEIEFNGEHGFPDITLVSDNGEKYGIEVKTSKGKNILGNSIMEKEKSEVPSKNLFLLLIKYRDDNDYESAHVINYFKAIKHVKITHSPRYVLSIDEQNGLFSDLSYEEIDDLRKDDRKILLMAYERSDSDSFPEWFTSFVNDNIGDDEALNLIPFDKLDNRETIFSKSFIFCPIVFSNSGKKFKCVEEFMISEGIFPPRNLRDKFTAGGQVDHCPKILETFKRYKENICDFWKSDSPYERRYDLIKFWHESQANNYDKKALFELWRELVIKNFQKSGSNNKLCLAKLQNTLRVIKSKALL